MKMDSQAFGSNLAVVVVLGDVVPAEVLLVLS